MAAGDKNPLVSACFCLLMIGGLAVGCRNAKSDVPDATIDHPGDSEAKHEINHPADSEMTDTQQMIDVASDPEHDESSEVGCVREGQRSQPFSTTPDCCPGLVAIRAGFPIPGYPPFDCSRGIDARVCSKCGNGICEDWELPCGCPADCLVDGGALQCGAMQCAPTEFCVIQGSGSDSGAPSYSCVQTDADCPGHVFSCECSKAKSCPIGCDSRRRTVTCAGI
jgi:hypothetical protein